MLSSGFSIAAAKTQCSEFAHRIAAISHQSMGAMGFTHEHILHHYTRRLWVWRRDFGSESFWGEKIGQSFAKAGFIWTRALCEADSDGDGLTNGEELGDPCCEWSAAAAAAAAMDVSKAAVRKVAVAWLDAAAHDQTTNQPTSGAPRRDLLGSCVRNGCAPSVTSTGPVATVTRNRLWRHVITYLTLIVAQRCSMTWAASINGAAC